jgi:1-acyl-sn-glycerol-3-phosphate acyltransferase
MSVATGIVTSTFIGANMLLACIPLYAMGLLRLVSSALRLESASTWLSGRMDLAIDYWVGGNRLMFRLLKLSNVDVRWEGCEPLARKGWFIAVSNHQSWSDIVILQAVLFPKAPPLKFFTKQQLLWIPFFGAAMWLLGFPYVRRFSRDKIAANPALLELDQQSTIDACDGFRKHPTTVLNFLEGTRFTQEKHASQQARFSNLLNPKAGGLALVVAAMENKIDYLIDITIDYPDGIPTFWEFLKGECNNVDLLVQCRELPAQVQTASGVDATRTALEPWVEAIWEEKDIRLRHRREAAG